MKPTFFGRKYTTASRITQTMDDCKIKKLFLGKIYRQIEFSILQKMDD